MSATVGARTGWLPLAVLLVGAVLPPIDFFIVNVALPSIREDLHTSPAETQLVISAYAAGYAVFLITGGRFALGGRSAIGKFSARDSTAMSAMVSMVRRRATITESF